MDQPLAVPARTLVPTKVRLLQAKPPLLPPRPLALAELVEVPRRRLPILSVRCDFFAVLRDESEGSEAGG